MRHILPPRFVVITVLVALALLLPQASGAAPAPPAATGLRYEAGEVLIGWEPGEGPVAAVPREPGRLGADRADPGWQAASAAHQPGHGLTVLDARPEHGPPVGRAAGSETAEIARLEALPWVRYAEPNYLCLCGRCRATRTTPTSRSSGTCTASSARGLVADPG